MSKLFCFSHVVLALARTDESGIVSLFYETQGAAEAHGNVILQVFGQKSETTDENWPLG